MLSPLDRLRYLAWFYDTDQYCWRDASEVWHGSMIPTIPINVLEGEQARSTRGSVLVLDMLVPCAEEERQSRTEKTCSGAFDSVTPP